MWSHRGWSDRAQLNHASNELIDHRTKGTNKGLISAMAALAHDELKVVDEHALGRRDFLGALVGHKDTAAPLIGLSRR